MKHLGLSLLLTFLLVPMLLGFGGGNLYNPSAGGTAAGGGGTVGGTGTDNRIMRWNGSANAQDSLASIEDDGSLSIRDSGLALRLRIFTDGTPDAVIKPVSATLRIQDSAGADGLLFPLSLPPHLPIGYTLEPIAAPAAHATRDKVFKDTADGLLKARKSTADGGALVILEGSGSAFVEQAFIPTLGQTVFTLSSSYVGGAGLSALHINTAHYEETVDYTISGTVLTWLDTPFTLDTSDRVVVQYQTN